MKDLCQEVAFGWRLREVSAYCELATEYSVNKWSLAYESRVIERELTGSYDISLDVCDISFLILVQKHAVNRCFDEVCLLFGKDVEDAWVNGDTLHFCRG